jgi:hypothetical protein
MKHVVHNNYCSKIACRHTLRLLAHAVASLILANQIQ